MTGRAAAQQPVGARRRRYRETFRRVLLDMHIPDWDPRFLSRFSVEEVLEVSEKCRLDGVMIYFQSHVGLCYWPTRSGEQHRAFRGRDPIGKLLEGFAFRDVPVCAYYSVNFNNWAYLRHPKWRLQPASRVVMGVLPRERYGVVCLNQAGYRSFIRDQVDEMLSTYDVDAIFFDMVWWNGVCVCEACRSRYFAESGHEIPETIDWTDPVWNDFQRARERWLMEFATWLRETARAVRSDIDVYHNFAMARANWTRAVSFESARAHDFLGGDFYGDRREQLVVSRLMLNLTENRPAEFMTTVAASLIDHERLQTQDQLDMKGFAAVAAGSAFLAIAAIDPEGTINPGMIRRIGQTFEKIAPYDSLLGGEPIEDIAVYFSSHSKMTFWENGTKLSLAQMSGAANYPHARAVEGACRLLQQAHLPFGVITALQLATLERFRVIVLPNVERMTPEEADAFRRYVLGGGRLYASRNTSLWSTDGSGGRDFALADIFGCHFLGGEEAGLIYLDPKEDTMAGAVAPERLIAHRCAEDGSSGVVRVSCNSDTEVLATITLPYGYPDRGAVENTSWASIHSSPPWDETDRPALLHARRGLGEVIFSAADLECFEDDAHDSVFKHCIRKLLAAQASIEADTHRAVWVGGFAQPANNRIVLSFLNNQAELPAIPIADVRFWVRLPKGTTCTIVRIAPDRCRLTFQETPAGVVSAILPKLSAFEMVVVDYVSTEAEL